MKQSLLEKAQSIPIENNGPTKKRTDEEIQLCLGWLCGEVRTHQVAVIRGFKRDASCYTWILITLREAMKKGLLKKR